MMTDQQERLIASYMRALEILFEGKAKQPSRIHYHAVIGWDFDTVGECCRTIDANDDDGVLALFDPASIEQGPAFIGVCIRDHPHVRLELGALRLLHDGERAVLVTTKRRSHLLVEHGRFVEHMGTLKRGLASGEALARRRLAELAAKEIPNAHYLIAA